MVLYRSLSLSLNFHFRCGEILSISNLTYGVMVEKSVRDTKRLAAEIRLRENRSRDQQTSAPTPTPFHPARRMRLQMSESKKKTNNAYQTAITPNS